jgi:iron complex outermembrane recepter protein
MSELMNAQNIGRRFRWQLLTTASALALVAAIYGTNASEAADQDADRPTVWIELGGQLENLSGGKEALSPPFMASITQANLLSALDVQQPPTHAIGAEGKISFQPENSNWVFSASVRYGRSQASRHRDQQTANAHVPKYQFTTYGFHLGGISYYPNGHVKFADGTAKQNESHAVLDFQAGKDVGLGLFGGHGSSVLSVGVRVAQFTSKANVSLHVEPDVQYQTAPIASLPGFIAWLNPHIHFHDYAATADSERSFRSVGPTLSWNASTLLSSEEKDGEITLDWGLNGAILFGRQKAAVHHKTVGKSYYLTRLGVGNGSLNDHFVGPCQKTGGYGRYNYTSGACAHHTATASHNRSREVVVPNVGGFAGLSFRYSNAKVSFGYRGDFFFGALDTGVDTAKRTTVGFYGPFASISIGIGG